MRQLINILYRRILYKIPLKLLLVILALFAVCFASFSHAELLADFGRANGTSISSAVQLGGATKTTCFYTVSAPESDGCAISFNNSSWDGSMIGGDHLICVYGSFYFRCNRSHTFRIFSTDNIVAPSSKCQSSYSLLTQNQCNSQYSGYILPSNCPSLDPMTSLQCQTEYSLIPISSVNQSYCVNNNLCPTCPTCQDCEECPVCPVGSGGVSSLYINDILHIGSPFIYMTIPQELSWDYEYTQGGTNMNIDIEGYNVDYEYMDGVVDIQNYKPNGEDLTNLVSSVLPLFVPGLVIILFLYFIFRFIKKIF